MGELYFYASREESIADRSELRRLLAALEATDAALCKDECKTWVVQGTKGHIYTQRPSGRWLLVAHCRSVRQWSATKQRLSSFCKVGQDGDDEGALLLERLPDRDQAVTIRDVLGIRKRRTDTPETLQRLSDQAKSRFPRKGADNDGTAPPCPIPTPTPLQSGR